MVDFLFEIGCEEIPAGELSRAAQKIEDDLRAFLKDNKVFFRSSRLFFTPRRIGIVILGIARHQRESVVEIQGPPKKFAYDENGQPTEMLHGFLRSQSLPLEAAVVRKTSKGEYVFVPKPTAGKETKELLKDFLPKLIGAIPFTKTMIWDETKVRFSRPVRWIVALFDTRILPVRFGHIEAGKNTYVFDRGVKISVKLGKPRDHLLSLRKEGVITEPAERRKVILQKTARVEKRIKAKIVPDPELVEELVNMTEYPEVAVGEFAEEYLGLPREVLTTALRAHQRLFAFDKTNCFLVVFNGTKRMAHAVKRGFEMVVKSRLDDALFYYNQDLKHGLDRMVEELKGVTWIEGLGTLYDKTGRLLKLAGLMAGEINTKSNIRLDLEIMNRACRYAKADLVSQMVREKEFTSLQGVMGKHYAIAQGIAKNVANAVGEQYLPRYAGDALPKSAEGAILGLVDRIDSISGAFIAGRIPSGSQDPLALRRHGYSIVQIVIEMGLHFSLGKLVTENLKLYGRDAKLAQDIMIFIYDRLDRYLGEHGIAYDEAKAVLATRPDDLSDTLKRCQALNAFRAREDFRALVIGQKRVANILKKVKSGKTVSEDLLNEPAEKALSAKGKQVTAALDPLLANRDYHGAFALLLTLRKEIDQLFDDVMVMVDDKTIRENRLALVSFIHEQFMKVADLSQIVLEGEEPKSHS